MWYRTNVIAIIPIDVYRLAMIVQNVIGNHLGLSVCGSLGLVGADRCELGDLKASLALHEVVTD